MLHWHLDLDVPVQIHSFEDALPFADVAGEMPAGTLLVMVLDEVRFARDVLVYDRGDSRPIDALKHVCDTDDPNVRSLLLASSRGDRSPLRRTEQDVADWKAMSAVCDRSGVRLLDWFIRGGELMFVPSELCSTGQGW